MICRGIHQERTPTHVREGFKQSIDRNNIFETLRYVDIKKHPENAIPLLPAIERIYPIMEPLPASWTITGAGWGNIGFAKAAERLGKDGRPFVKSLKPDWFPERGGPTERCSMCRSSSCKRPPK